MVFLKFEAISKFLAPTLKLLEHDDSQQEVEKILDGNFMRVFEQVYADKKKICKKVRLTSKKFTSRAIISLFHKVPSPKSVEINNGMIPVQNKTNKNLNI